jgi:hypothetical protein
MLTGAVYRERLRKRAREAGLGEGFADRAWKQEMDALAPGGAKDPRYGTAQAEAYLRVWQDIVRADRKMR